MDSYRLDVHTTQDRPGSYSSNGLRFATRDEAICYGHDLANRWYAVVDFKAEPTTDQVTHQWVDGRLSNINV